MGQVIAMKEAPAATEAQVKTVSEIVTRPAGQGKVVHVELPKRCPQCHLGTVWMQMRNRQVCGALECVEFICECGWAARVYWYATQAAKHRQVRRWNRIALAMYGRPGPRGGGAA